MDIRISLHYPLHMDRTCRKTWNTRHIHRRLCCRYLILARLGVITLRPPRGSGLPKAQSNCEVLSILPYLSADPSQPHFQCVWTLHCFPPSQLLFFHPHVFVVVTYNPQYIFPLPPNDNRSDALRTSPSLLTPVLCCTFVLYVEPLFTLVCLALRPISVKSVLLGPSL